MVSFNVCDDKLQGIILNFSNHPSVLKIKEKFQLNERVIGKILTELSKAYDCLPHDLLTVKLEAYGIGSGSLNLLLDYLSFKKQRTSWFRL